MQKFKVIPFTKCYKNDIGFWSIQESGPALQLLVDADLTTKDGLMLLAHMLKNEGASYTANIRKLSFTDVTSDIIEVKNKEDLKPICRLEKIKF